MRSLFRGGLWCMLLVSCGGSTTRTGIDCGPGTVESGGECVVAAGGTGGAGASAGRNATGGRSTGSGGALQGGATQGGATQGGAMQGGSAQGGGAAQGGTSGVCANPLPITDALVEDFEGGALSWWGVFDGTGTVTGTSYAGGPPEANSGEIDGSSYAARVQGSGLQMWGAVIGLVPWTMGCVDLSAFSGVSFWAKGGPGTGTELSAALIIEFPVPTTVPVADGGECAVGCYDHNKHIVFLTEEWQHFSLDWTDFGQSGWGVPGPFTPGRVHSLQFAMAGGVGGIDFDWWVDEIELDAN